MVLELVLRLWNCPLSVRLSLPDSILCRRIGLKTWSLHTVNCRSDVVLDAVSTTHIRCGCFSAFCANMS